ncbi:MAG: BspA family leucine-rich repeat surface protein [Bacteroidota bacterium]
MTSWTFDVDSEEIRFHALTDGEVHYTWSTTQSGKSGKGTFTRGIAGAVSLTNLDIPANDTLILSMEPENLKRFYMVDNSDDSFNDELVDVAQWGAVSWSSMDSAFYRCRFLTISASDAPDLSNVTSMRFLFREAIEFNSPIGHWDVSNVTDMGFMFSFANAFNQKVGDWDVSNVTDMSGMFSNMQGFNQPVDRWDVSNVTDMNGMFYDARSFNQNLGKWQLNEAVDLTGMLSFSDLNCENYTSTLIGWYENRPEVTNVSLAADGLAYGTNAETVREILINERNWIISGDLSSGTRCGESSSEDESISDDEDETTEEKPLGFSAPSEMNSYPIPTKDYLTIEASETQTIRVMSLDGRIVIETEIQPGANTIDLSASPAGSYLIKTESGQEQRVIKK